MYPAESDEVVVVQVGKHLLLPLHVAGVGSARLRRNQHVRDVQIVLRLGANGARGEGQRVVCHGVDDEGVVGFGKGESLAG